MKFFVAVTLAAALALQASALPTSDLRVEVRELVTPVAATLLKPLS